MYYFKSVNFECKDSRFSKIRSNVSHKSGLKLGQVTWVIWVKKVTFCVGQLGQIWIIKISRSDLNLELTALSDYFDLFANCLKVQSYILTIIIA